MSSHVQPPAEYTAYLRDALAWLKAAKNNLNEIPMATYYESALAVELALKAVLCKNNGLTEDLMRGNRGHNIELLKQRIVERGCLTKDFFDKPMNKAIRHVAHANIPMSGAVFINTVKKRSSTRYPKDGIASVEYITPEIAFEEYEYADYILKKIQHVLNV